MHVREERERLGLDVDIEVASEAGDDALARGGHEVRLEVAREALHDVDGEERQRDQPEHDDVAADEDVVHHRLDEPGGEPLHRRYHERQERAEDEHRDVRPEVGDEPAVGRERADHRGGDSASSRR